MVSDAEWMTLEECRRRAIETERGRISDWLDSLAAAGEKKFGTVADDLYAQKALKFVSPLIRSGSYSPTPPMSETVKRCKICDWPLAKTREEGCVEDSCSYRPQEGSSEWYRIQERRRSLTPPTEKAT